MKQRIALITSVLLLLGTVSACGDSTTSVESTTAATVANLFAPTTAPTETESDTQPDSGTESTSSSKKDIPTPGEMGGGIERMNENQQDAIGNYITYDGGEMHIFLKFTLTGRSKIGVGVHFFVDGQPQPYYTPEDSTYSYMHTIYPPEVGEYIMELIFVPVTGEAGDTVEYGFYVIEYPDYFLDDEWEGNAQSANRCLGFTFRVKYQETPPAAEIVPVQDRVLSTSLTYVDLSSSEISSISQDEVEWMFYVEGKADWGYFWNVEETGTESVTVRFVLEGSSLAEFGVVVFYNHEPVSISPEDLMLVSTNNGQKAILEAEIDISDFDGEGVLYAVVVPRNYLSNRLGSSCLLTATGTYYFSDAASREELLAQGGVS